MVRLINKNDYPVLIATNNIGEVKPGEIIDVLGKPHIDHLLGVGFEKAPKFNKKESE